MKKSELKQMIKEELKLTEKESVNVETMMNSISNEGLYALWWYLKDWDELISTSTDPKEVKALKNLKKSLPQVGKDLNVLYKKYYGDTLV